MKQAKPTIINHTHEKSATTMTRAMWHFISERISTALDTPFIVQHRTAAAGGDTHQSFVIRDERRRFFVKIHPLNGERPLEAEADGLRALAAVDGVTVPEVITAGDISVDGVAHEYLVLSHLRFTAQTSDADFALGKMIATLHNATGYDTYGWHRDNYIGATPQINAQSHDWASFFAHQRIEAMLHRLHDAGYSMDDPQTVVDAVKQRLAGHHPAPSLLHGDLWSGNAGVTSRGPVIFDPAVYIGDAETDLAMTDLFGGFSPAFYEGYSSLRPVAPDYRMRKPVYQLYHILNHAVLFGGSYLTQAASLIAEIKK
ncbi:fructosamine kinase family protein [Alteromonas sp. CYL-A6]|uniref:fructosamine kinase family protein n=1 Tax=Alteromonas nitratireducens TaxID=3390813 RepID=UPI0034BE5E6E